MIRYIIEVAQKRKYYIGNTVSADNDEIAGISKELGAEVPFIKIF